MNKIRLSKWLYTIFGVRRSSCNCGDINCKREIKGTKEGKLYIENHFTCGKVKNIIEKYKHIRL